MVSQYFWPESFIINDLVLKMKEQAHQVSVYTGKPNYPEGKLYAGYSHYNIQKEYYNDDILIYRVPLRPRKQGALNLALNYCSFVYWGLRHAVSFAKKRQFDNILVFSLSPVTSAIPAIFLKWLTGTPLTIWVQDLWPESLSATGYIKNRWVLKIVEKLVQWIYAHADLLLVQSTAFIAPVKYLARHERVEYYPNSAKDLHYNPKCMPPLPEDLANLLSTQFCVVFAGNIGSAQAVETIIAAAIILKDSPIQIVLVGSGSMLDWVAAKKKEEGLEHLILAGRYSSDFMPALFHRADALLVTLKNDPIFALTVPSKVQAYLSAGKPIIASMDGEGARVLEESGAALISAAEDAQGLANSIQQLSTTDKKILDQMGQMGREYFLNHFEMSQQVTRLITLLEQNKSKKKRVQ